VADVSPASTADALESYGDGSTCWESADSAETCADACAAALRGRYFDFPASTACDDGTPLPSSAVLRHDEWSLDVVEADPTSCSSIPGVGSVHFEVTFRVTESTEFTGDFLKRAPDGTPYSEWYEAACTNAAFEISCEWEGYGYEVTFQGALDADLTTLTGALQHPDCRWDLSGEPTR
jgi:hypothetical protein